MKNRNFSIILILFCLWAVSIYPINAALTADWGDVVNVRYSLYLDAAHTQPVEGNEDRELRYIYLAPGTDVDIPKQIEDLFPDQVNSQPPQLHSGYLNKFEEGIIGMQINQEKNVHVPAADAYTDPSHQLYNQDLYFKITLLEILYDASSYGTTTSDGKTTDSPTPSDPLRDFGAIILIGGSVIIIGGTLLLRNVQSSRRMEKTMSEDRKRSSIQQSTLQKEKDQLRELRELTESYSPSEDTSSEKSEIKFRRRRRR